MKLSRIISVTLALLICSIGMVKAITFKDMSETHWASDSVQKIVDMGITRGYPDGTFRGNKTMNRYDIAIFLAKFAHYFEKRIEGEIPSAITDTASTDSLRNEVYLLKQEIESLKKEIVSLKAY